MKNLFIKKIVFTGFILIVSGISFQGFSQKKSGKALVNNKSMSFS
jgi:hypothetical protein